MKKFILEPVDNGLIKIVIDENSDGAGNSLEKKKIYILEKDVAASKKLIEDLIDDLGLYLGNDYSKDKISINQSYGPKYQLSSADILAERKKLTHRLNELQSMIPNRKTILNGEKNDNN